MRQNIGGKYLSPPYEHLVPSNSYQPTQKNPIAKNSIVTWYISAQRRHGQQLSYDMKTDGAVTRRHKTAKCRRFWIAGKGKLGAYAMKCVAAGAHLPTPWILSLRSSQTMKPTTTAWAGRLYRLGTKGRGPS